MSTRILVAEDETISRRLLESQLRSWGYEVVLAVDGLEALRAFESPDAPRLAILDWVMPGIEGPELCRRIRRLGAESYTYVLLLTGRAQRENVIEGLEAGADDYLTKPFDAQELRVRLRTGERVLELQQQLVSAREELRFEAMRDSLTGVWNRAAVLEVLARELARARRERSDVGVLMLDVDHFKRINDTFGHPAGDAVLRDLSRRLARTLRRYDAIGRLGGEEFLIVLPGCDGARTRSAAERLRAAIAGEPMGSPECAVSVTASFGGAACERGLALDVAALVRAADAALYRAKRSGRDRVETESLAPAQPAA